jgi:hypothetical protein
VVNWVGVDREVVIADTGGINDKRITRGPRNFVKGLRRL